MHARQTRISEQWLITDERIGDRLMTTVRRLPRGSAILLRHHGLSAGQRERLKRELRRAAKMRGLRLVDEQDRATARVHSSREIRMARTAGAKILLLSPLFMTRSHPKWTPIPRMRAAALARLCGRPRLALGGMDRRRFAQVRALGFDGWAAIDAWRAPRI